MIPKMLHYCWFGGDKMPALETRCISSWSVLLPDWDIRLWDESNFDIAQCSFAQGAYDNAAWAFVSDYARFKILHEYGGVFLDTDVELLRPFDDLLDKPAFTGFTRDEFFAAPGLIVASEAVGRVVGEVAREYESMQFEPVQGRINPQTSPRVLTKLLVESYGLKRDGSYQDLAGITVCPAEWFDPLNPRTGEMTITSETYSIHHYSGTWLNPAKKYRIEMRKKLAPKVGPELSWLLSSVLSVAKYGKKAF